MKSWAIVLPCALLVSLILSGCATLLHGDNRHAVCSLLKSKVVFSGSTSDDRQAQIQNAEKPLNELTYDVNCQ